MAVTAVCRYTDEEQGSFVEFICTTAVLAQYILNNYKDNWANVGVYVNQEYTTLNIDPLMYY